MIKGLRLIFIFVAMITFSMATSGWAANLVINGDFESGNTGFGTDFLYKSDLWDWGPPADHGSGIFPPGTYTTATDVPDYHPNAYSYGDHTSGKGNYMMVNGTTDGSIDLVWSQTVSDIDPNKKYIFSVWGSSWERVDIPGLFAVFINGERVSDIVEAPAVLGVWNELSFIWEPGELDFVANIAIANTATAYFGNDFALDDISFQVVPIPQTVWLFGTALLFLIGLKRKSSG